MPNHCDYEMKVTGKKCNVDEFIGILKADYERTPDDPLHFWRLFEVSVDDMEEYGNDICAAIISGICAWSIKSCMCESGYQAYDDTGRGTTLQAESKRLSLAVQVFSRESGSCFQEHYIYILGNMECEICEKFVEIFLGSQTLEEYNAENNTCFTEVNPDNYICDGDFEWEYNDYEYVFNNVN